MHYLGIDLGGANITIGLTNTVNIFQPQIFCIGGGVCGEYLLKPTIKTIRRCEYGATAQTNFSQIKSTEFDNDACIIGAVLGK